MEDNAKLVESLLEKATEYGKTSFELAKLKALDKASDVVSSFIPNSIVFLLIASFLFFFNLGVAIWLDGILGVGYGFFIVAAFYGLLGIVVHFFMHKWLKKLICNYFIKQVLK